MVETYFSNLRQEMLQFLPRSPKRILDVGCGEGEFGLQLIKLYNAEVWGVEPNRAAAHKAKDSLFHVINSNFEEGIEIPQNYFDCIVFNDVIEHMLFPEVALNLSSKFLSKESHSVLVASIPNFRYIKNIYEILIQKDFRYKGHGILDATHYKFFTENSIRRFFADNQFLIEKMEGINPTKSLLFRIANSIFLGYIDDMRYLQFAVVARPFHK